MMENKFEAIIFDKVNIFISSLPKEDLAKIKGAITYLEMENFESIDVKKLRRKLKELKVRQYRLIFFIIQTRIYFVNSFIKKTNKTPKKEINLAEKYYKLITNNLN